VLPQFTGISDPYEPPTDADIVVDGTAMAPDVATEWILQELALCGLFEAQVGH